jgi:hypothetical protein
MTDTIQPAIVRDTGDLLASLRERQRALGWTDEFISSVAGFDVAAVLGRGRRPTCSTLDTLLGVFAISLIPVPDHDKAQRLVSWWDTRPEGQAAPMFQRRARAQKAARARWAKSTPEERSDAARHAIVARWAKERSA